MAKFTPFNFFKAITIGAIGGAFAFILSLLYRALQIPIYYYKGDFFSFTASTVAIDLRSQIVSAGNFKEVGVKILGLFEGFFGSYTPEDFFYVILGGIFVFFIGRLIVSFIQKQSLMKYATLLAWITGGFVFSVIVALMTGLPFTSTVFSMSIYTISIGIILEILFGTVKSLQFLKA